MLINIIGALTTKGWTHMAGRVPDEILKTTFLKQQSQNLCLSSYQMHLIAYLDREGSLHFCLVLEDGLYKIMCLLPKISHN